MCGEVCRMRNYDADISRCEGGWETYLDLCLCVWAGSLDCDFLTLCKDPVEEAMCI